MSFVDSGHKAKSVDANPVVVMMETTWNEANLRELVNVSPQFHSSSAMTSVEKR